MTLAFGRREFLGGVAAAASSVDARFPTRPATAALQWRSRQAAARHGRPDAPISREFTILGIATGASDPLNHRLTDRTPAGVTARADGARKRLASLRSWTCRTSKPANLDAAVALAGHDWPTKFRFPFGDAIVLDPNIGFRNALCRQPAGSSTSLIS